MKITLRQNKKFDFQNVIKPTNTSKFYQKCRFDGLHFLAVNLLIKSSSSNLVRQFVQQFIFHVTHTPHNTKQIKNNASIKNY